MIPRILAVVLLALLVASPAAGDNATRKQRIDAKIETLNDKIASARARERELSGEIANVTARIRTLEAEVGDVSRDLETLEQDLTLHRERLAHITELWRLQTRKLGFLRRQHAEAIDRLSDRLVAIYESGRVSTVDVLLDAENFNDLVSRLEYARELARQDQRIAESVGRAKERMRFAQARTTVTRKKVAAVARTVAIRTEQTRAARNELLARENALGETRAEKRQRLASVQASKEEYLHEVNALAAVSAQLAARIQSSTASLPPVRRTSSGLIWPVSGPVTSGSAGAGGGCTRGSTSPSRRARRSLPRRRVASSTPVGWAATGTW